MRHELHYVLRSVSRRKSFALVSVLTLALGIGSATAIYSVVAWHLFREASDPGVYMLGVRTEDGEAQMYSPVAFAEAYAANKDVIAEAAYATGVSRNVVVDTEPVSTWLLAVSANFFDQFHVVPAQGRVFAPSECQPGRDNVVIVTHGFWKAHLGASPSAIGARVRVGGAVCTVIGVLPENPHLPVLASAPVFCPLTVKVDPTQPFENWLLAFVRLQPNVAPPQAEAALLASRPDVPPAAKDYAKALKPIVSSLALSEKFLHRELYWTLVGAVGFLYAIACLNATNLALVHLLGRRREFSVRAALGGRRWAILRLVWLETALLTLGGVLLGAFVANWMETLFSALARNPDPKNGWLSWTLNAQTYWALGGLGLATTLLTSLVPAAFLVRMNLNEGLKGSSGSVGESPGLSRTRSAFVVLQAAFAVVLLVGAGLMIRTFQRLEHLHLGFEPSHRVKALLAFPREPARSIERDNALLEGLKGALLRVPGVESIAYSSGSLLSGYNAAWTMIKARDDSKFKVALVYTEGDYVAAGGITLLSGRWAEEGSKSEVVINETLARKWFGGANPIGQYIRTDDLKTDPGWHVVGVAADVRETLRDEPAATVYVPARSSPEIVNTYVARLGRPADARELQALRAAIYAYNVNIVINSIEPLDKMLDDQTYNERLTFSVLRVLSGVALVLTLVGIFSIVAYTVDRRMGEFGIRMAIGATPASLMGLVLRRSLVLTLVGVVLGVSGALALTRFLRSLLYKSPPVDVMVIGGVAGLVVLSGVVACLLPARKASRPDLTKLLRQGD